MISAMRKAISIRSADRSSTTSITSDPGFLSAEGGEEGRRGGMNVEKKISTTKAAYSYYKTAR
jgi:hypothetical protein